MCISTLSACLPFDADRKQAMSLGGPFATRAYPAAADVMSSMSAATTVAQNFVQHNYHDHSHDQVDDANFSKQLFAGGGVAATFPIKLHYMLTCIETEGRSDIISWAPHGRAFVVKKPQEFANLFLRKYFNQSKFASFQRQLNLYGFNRLTRGPDKGGYYHSYFLRSKPLLAHKIQRFKIKGTQVRQRSNPDQEPNFYSMKPVGGGACSVRQEPQIQQQQRKALPLPVPCSSMTPEIVKSIAARTCEPLSRASGELHSLEDTMSAFGRDFHNVSNDQFNQRYKDEDSTSPSQDERRELFKSLSSAKPSFEMIDASPLVMDEDFAKMLEDIVDV